jgi:hypothetical protein
MKVQTSVTGIGKMAEVRADTRIRQALAQRQAERGQRPPRSPQASDVLPVSSAQGGK